MLKPEQPDSRRFQLMRLQTLITIENYLIDQMKDVPHWEPNYTKYLFSVLDASINREIEELVWGWKRGDDTDDT